ncbi:phytoene/squalene synthase family protein [Staphylococcus chromogenes]|nr:phytoene/squalene synthase family protein [Staphylococcus chromogenes]
MKFLRARSWRTTVSPLTLYRRAAAASAAPIIGHYSTSFSLAAKALAPRMRQDIHNLYAVVRIADEIVDGVATEAGLAPADAERALNAFHAEVTAALNTGFSTNPIVQAFSDTARRCDFSIAEIDAFFDSMRCDLTTTRHDSQSLDRYIYGSAEVIGLMCLKIFVAEQALSPRAQANCALGAKALGRAFQKINFLRDYRVDSTQLGRAYLELSPDTKAAFIAGIRQDLARAYRSIAMLPLTARAGVLSAYLLFSELTDLLDAATIEDIKRTRVNVPNSRKLLLAGRAVALAPRMKEN